MPDQFTQLQESVISGEGETAKRLAAELLGAGIGARQILEGALLPAMDVVGARMRSGECFIPEVLLSARTMQGALDLLKPHLAEGEAALLGTVVIGTVEGDLHDIGKNLVAMMLEGAGFAVINLGTSIPAATFVAAVREHKADILGLSALLTTTLPKMRQILLALTESFVAELGADGYGANAALAVEKAKELMGKR
jgi:5-methyltetrahydrofolate--homocysteine methyltransferase